MRKKMNPYENNFRLLREKFPEVADWVAQAGDDPRAEVIHCRDGMDNLRLRGLQGKSTYYYDMHEPLKEEREICENFSFTPDRVTFLIGLGLGYIMEILREKIEKGHKIVVIEKNPAILQKALAHTDFFDLLRSDQIIFTLPDRESIKKTVISQASDRFPEDIFILASPRLMAFDREYRDLYDQVIHFLADPIMMTCTGVNHGEIFALNEIENFPKFLFSPGIRNLADKFRGIPAIIVGAGPSLQKNVQHLPAAKEKALIVATAPIVRVLLAHDLSPDLTVSIDFNKENRIHFDGLCDPTVSPLVYPSRLAPDIVRDYQGDLFAIQDLSGLYGWLGKNWEFKGFVPGGASVSIYALMTVLFYGCDPIVFIGQDLAYTDRSHIDGVFLATRINPAESQRQFLWVEGVYGDRVPTIPPFLSYKLNIEEIIKRHPDRKFINCTEGGAKIEGAEIMPLRECLQKYCSQPRAIRWVLQEAQNLEKVDWVGLTAEIGKRITEVKEMRRLCQKGLKTNKKIKRKMQEGGLNDLETDQWILENYEASTAVQKFCGDFSLLKIFLRKETYKINRHQYVYIAEGAYDKREDLRIGLPRNRLILGAAQEALNTVHKKLAYLHWLFRKILRVQETLASETAGGEEHYRYGEVLARIGLHRPAVKEFEKAIARGFAGSAVYRTLGKSYLKMDQLAKAAEVFTQGLERFPEIGLFAEEKKELTSIKNSWLEKAENYLKEDNWVNALLWSRKLLREDPSHVRGGEIAATALRLRDQNGQQVEEVNDKENQSRLEKTECREALESAKNLMKRQSYSEALQCLEKTASWTARSSEFKRLAACCYAETGEIGKARELFAELIQAHPDSGIFHFNWGRALIRKGLWAEAAQELEKAASLERQIFYHAYFEAGCIYMKAKEYTKAIACFENYLATSPDSYELLGKVATCYLAQGRLFEAREKYEEALHIQPDYDAARMGLKRIAEMERRIHRRVAERKRALLGP